jgi:hypothetical protein
MLVKFERFRNCSSKTRKSKIYLFNSVADPGSGAFLTPGSGMGKNQDPDPR